MYFSRTNYTERWLKFIHQKVGVDLMTGEME